MENTYKMEFHSECDVSCTTFCDDSDKNRSLQSLASPLLCKSKEGQTLTCAVFNPIIFVNRTAWSHTLLSLRNWLKTERTGLLNFFFSRTTLIWLYSTRSTVRWPDDSQKSCPQLFVLFLSHFCLPRTAMSLKCAELNKLRVCQLESSNHNFNNLGRREHLNDGGLFKCWRGRCSWSWTGKVKKCTL